MHDLIIFGAQYLVAVPILATIYLAIRLKKPKKLELLFILVAGGIVSMLLARLGSHLYSNPRPFISDNVQSLITRPTDNGFPSEHTLLSAFLAFTVLVFSKKIGAALLIAALLIGVSRVAAGVHHATDIIGGFVFAGLGVLAAYGCLMLFEFRRKHNSPDT